MLWLTASSSSSAVATGLRRDEICSLRWEVVNLQDRVITVGIWHDTKSHHQRSVPLAGPAVTVLEGRHEEGARGYVFPGVEGGKMSGDYLGKKFKKFARMAELPENVTFHSLRSMCISWLVMNGVPLRMAQEIAGHASIQTTEGYAHLAPGAMRSAMDETFGDL